ncbi:C-C motif chemokine 2-like [Sardina pilchardus]|uniref:C-C motif chemokine 2-like n=1 Tax=Sardina pilchardus TaxID=27697 RepID=UPI002E13E537
MAKVTFSLCALLGLLLVFAAMGNSSKVNPRSKCCTKFQSKPLPFENIRGYILDRKCRLFAVKFITIKDRSVCADPKAQWAQDAMEFVRLNQTASA